MYKFYLKYVSFLRNKPLPANMLSTGFLLGCGDFMAQEFFPSKNTKNYDYSRTARAIIYGSCIFAPIGDKWYRFLLRISVLNRFVSSGTYKQPIDLVARVAVDQLFFAPIIGIPLYYTVMPLLELKTDSRYIWKKLLNNWWHTLRTNWLVWPLFQTLNFSVVPVHLRLTSVNVFSIGWNTYLSYVLNRNEKTLVDERDTEEVVYL